MGIGASTSASSRVAIVRGGETMPRSTSTRSEPPSRRNENFEEIQLITPGNTSMPGSSNTSRSIGGAQYSKPSARTGNRISPLPEHLDVENPGSSLKRGGTDRVDRWSGSQGEDNRWQETYKQMQDQQDYFVGPYHNGYDFYSVVKAAQKNRQQEHEPTYPVEEDLVFETYYHSNGQSYQCLYQSGNRYYLDSWQTMEWQPFPRSWYDEGILVTDSVVKGATEPQVDSSDDTVAHQVGPGTPHDDPSGERNLVAPSDDREGSINHPIRGRLATYMFEEKRNVHCFFDEESGCWVKLPVSWELHSPFIRQFLSQIQEMVPEWQDENDMLAALRVSNYDPHACISTYYTIGEQALSQNRSDDRKVIQDQEESIKNLQERCSDMAEKLAIINAKAQEQRRDKETLEREVCRLQEQVSSLEVEAKEARAQVEVLQQQRPKTPALQAKKTQVITETMIVEKETVDPESVKKLHEVVKNLHKAHIQLKMAAEQKMGELAKLMKQTSVATMRIKLLDTSQSQEVEELRLLYRKEALQKKLLYNKLQELQGNIRVFCRCRRDNRVDCSLQFKSEQEVLPPGGRKSYNFDRVFDDLSSQEEVFADTLPIVTSCVDGYNVCIMAYGQTGSGKTYTMMGPKADPGVNIRAIEELLRICQEREKVDFTLKVSMLEIYNETVIDLLSREPAVRDVRSQGNQIVMPGLTEISVQTADDIESIINNGDKNRTVASTKMNSSSSRSHLLVMITVEGHNKVSGATSLGRLTLCDLAGSERIAKTEAEGQRLVEAAAINKSLSSLGQVFSALSKRLLHIPYRNSKLTHLLQPSLGGDAKVCLFVNVSPDERNISETISTLTFGSNARQVQVGQAKQNIKQGFKHTSDMQGVRSS